MSAPLWKPSEERVERAQMSAFTRRAEVEAGERFGNYAALHRWSIDEPEAFWRSVWSFCEVVGEGPGERVLVGGKRMPGACWFPDARLNFAENQLRRRDAAPALVFHDEAGARRLISFADLQGQVGRLAAALCGLGLEAGDRVAGFLPNLPEAVIATLASASLGAIWTSCSPDFGPRGVLDRFAQVEPRVLFCADGYRYNGRRFDCLESVGEILSELPSVEQIVVIPNSPNNPISAIFPRRCASTNSPRARLPKRSPARRSTCRRCER